MENLLKQDSATRLAQQLADRHFSAEELAAECLKNAAAASGLGIFLHLDSERILASARRSDERRKQGKTLGPLDGIPVALKDNICELGAPTTCASRFLENFIAPYDAHVVELLQGSGAVLFGRTNMDEFAMGSSTENSAFQITRNPHNANCVPGGSSGGSAAAVAAGIVPLALGSDTGGSIRQPAAFCGVVGLKPTYGRVSRYGLVAFASSLDQIGPFARTTEDAALLLSAISGVDHRDSTSRAPDKDTALKAQPKALTSAELKGVRVGLYMPASGAVAPEIQAAIEHATDFLRRSGAKIVPVHSPLWEKAIPLYYILATAEASSNLSRYDGIRYGMRSKEAQTLEEVYVQSRTAGFGTEVSVESSWGPLFCLLATMMPTTNQPRKLAR